MILGISKKRDALPVDHLLGHEFTVVKPLGRSLHNCPSVAGATVSDWLIRLLLDPAGLVVTSEILNYEKLASAIPQVPA